MIPVVIIVPVALAEPGGELMAALGETEADRDTFAPGLALLAEDAQGQRYLVAAGLVPKDWPARALAALVQPRWAVDLSAAVMAQKLLRAGEPPSPETITLEVGTSDANRVLARLGLHLVKEARRGAV